MLRNQTYDNVKSEETTVISGSVKIEGKVTSKGNIRVDGDIEGDITSQGGNVTVGETGQINGQIHAEVITIGGKVSGTVRAKEKLVIDSKGNLQGDIYTKTLVIEAGAKFDGKSQMSNSKPDVKDQPKPNVQTGKP